MESLNLKSKCGGHKNIFAYFSFLFHVANNTYHAKMSLLSTCQGLNLNYHS
jgi:hypothetical protein